MATERFMRQHYGASGYVPKEKSMSETYNVPDTPETLAKWIWFHYVGIPVTEPYDKEYTRLFDLIEALNRQSFVAGLNECRKQMSKSKQEISG